MSEARDRVMVGGSKVGDGLEEEEDSELEEEIDRERRQDGSFRRSSRRSGTSTGGSRPSPSANAATAAAAATAHALAVAASAADVAQRTADAARKATQARDASRVVGSGAARTRGTAAASSAEAVPDGVGTGHGVSATVRRVREWFTLATGEPPADASMPERLRWSTQKVAALSAIGVLDEYKSAGSHKCDNIASTCTPFVWIFQSPEQRAYLMKTRPKSLQLDSTHGLNQHGFPLSTLLGYDAQAACSMPVAFMISSVGTADVFTTFLKEVLRAMAGAYFPLYIVTDDDASEQKGVRDASAELLRPLHIPRSRGVPEHAVAAMRLALCWFHLTQAFARYTDALTVEGWTSMSRAEKAWIDAGRAEAVAVLKDAMRTAREHRTVPEAQATMRDAIANVLRIPLEHENRAALFVALGLNPQLSRKRTLSVKELEARAAGVAELPASGARHAARSASASTAVAQPAPALTASRARAQKRKDSDNVSAPSAATATPSSSRTAVSSEAAFDVASVASGAASSGPAMASAATTAASAVGAAAAAGVLPVDGASVAAATAAGAAAGIATAAARTAAATAAAAAVRAAAASLAPVAAPVIAGARTAAARAGGGRAATASAAPAVGDGAAAVAPVAPSARRPRVAPAARAALAPNDVPDAGDSAVSALTGLLQRLCNHVEKMYVRDGRVELWAVGAWGVPLPHTTTNALERFHLELKRFILHYRRVRRIDDLFNVLVFTAIPTLLARRAESLGRGGASSLSEVERTRLRALLNPLYSEAGKVVLVDKSTGAFDVWSVSLGLMLRVVLAPFVGGPYCPCHSHGMCQHLMAARAAVHDDVLEKLFGMHDAVLSMTRRYPTAEALMNTTNPWTPEGLAFVTRAAAVLPTSADPVRAMEAVVDDSADAPSFEDEEENAAADTADGGSVLLLAREHARHQKAQAQAAQLERCIQILHSLKLSARGLTPDRFAHLRKSVALALFDAGHFVHGISRAPQLLRVRAAKRPGTTGAAGESRGGGSEHHADDEEESEGEEETRVEAGGAQAPIRGSSAFVKRGRRGRGR